MSISNCCTVAPNTLRIPISRIRFSIVNDARPARPMQQIKMASPAKIFVSLLMSSSVKNFFCQIPGRQTGIQMELKDYIF